MDFLKKVQRHGEVQYSEKVLSTLLRAVEAGYDAKGLQKIIETIRKNKIPSN
jgi:hypothetical protein